MKESFYYRISEAKYKKAVKNGAESIIGAAERKKYRISDAKVAEIGGSYWLGYMRDDEPFGYNPWQE